MGTPGVLFLDGRNIPAAPSLVVSLSNLSAMIVMSTPGIRLWTRTAVDRPTAPAPITATRGIVT